MNLSDIPDRSRVFIDANIFIYHFTGVSDQCSDFLRRCEVKEIKAFSSVNILLEVLHRLMMIEVVRKNLLKPPNLVKKLQKNPPLIKNLDEYFSNTKKIIDMGIGIIPLDQKSFTDSQYFRKNYGLLVNDSLILSAMKEKKIKILASNDDAFLSLEMIDVFQPTDVFI
jgi:predicted nucleic acid-binding protein